MDAHRVGVNKPRPDIARVLLVFVRIRINAPLPVVIDFFIVECQPAATGAGCWNND